MTLPILITDQGLLDELRPALEARGLIVTDDPSAHRDTARIYRQSVGVAIDDGIRSSLPGDNPEEIAASVARELASIATTGDTDE